MNVIYNKEEKISPIMPGPVDMSDAKEICENCGSMNVHYEEGCLDCGYNNEAQKIKSVENPVNVEKTETPLEDFDTKDKVAHSNSTTKKMEEINEEKEKNYDLIIYRKYGRTKISNVSLTAEIIEQFHKQIYSNQLSFENEFVSFVFSDAMGFSIQLIKPTKEKKRWWKK